MAIGLSPTTGVGTSGQAPMTSVRVVIGLTAVLGRGPSLATLLGGDQLSASVLACVSIDVHARVAPVVPDAAVRAVPARLLLLCLLLRSSWLTVEDDRHSAPPDCCIAGAEGQSWPCRSAWLLAFQSSSVLQPYCVDRDRRKWSLSDRELPSSSQRSGKACLQGLSAPTQGWSLSSDRCRARALDEHAA